MAGFGAGTGAGAGAAGACADAKRSGWLLLVGSALALADLEGAEDTCKVRAGAVVSLERHK